MAKTVATLLGVVFILVGVVGFASPGLLGTHLSTAHNAVHIISGLIALYFGLMGSLGGAKAFCIAFGLVYLLLGICGFALGGPGTIPSEMGGMPTDTFVLKVIPGTLELAKMDHIVHILLGALFLAGGLLTGKTARS